MYRVISADEDGMRWPEEDIGNLRVALCGNRGDYELPGWTMIEWERSKLTYGGGKTKAEEAIWYSPACIDPSRQLSIFTEAGA